MKVLVARKRIVSFEQVDNVHYCSVVSSRLLVEKKEDPRVFNIPYTIGSFNFTRSLCYFGS